MSARVLAHVALLVMVLASGATTASAASAQCGPLPPPTGAIVRVATVQELQDAVAAVRSNTTILIADGVYDLTHTLNIDRANQVTLRSVSGDREAVVLRAPGMSNQRFGSVPHVVAIFGADDVTLADLTLRDAYYHLIQVHGENGPQRPRFYNLHLVDSGEQFIKGSTSGRQNPRKYSDGGLVECSTFEYTDRARSDYTNAVDVLAAANWVIRDNVFLRMRAPLGRLAGPAILMWRNSIDTLVERNLFIECDRAIALGLSPPDANARSGERRYEHQGGVVRNNMIARAGPGDVGITVNYARDYRLYHNTVVLNGTFPWTIEYRFAVSAGEVGYNLTDGTIQSRDVGRAVLQGNLIGAPTDWFVNLGEGDLHLTSGARASVQTTFREVVDDFDGDPRPTAATRDVGADQRRVQP